MQLLNALGIVVDALKLGPASRKLRFGNRHRSGIRSKLRLLVSRVDLGNQIALFDGVTFVEVQQNHRSTDLGLERHLVNGL